MRDELWNEGWTFWTDGEGVRRTVRLPHDAMLYAQRGPESPAKDAGGYFYGDVYHYEKRFVPREAWAGQEVVLVFDGVYRNATVTLNGTQVAWHAYGYTPFSARLTEALLPGCENVLEVVADNSELPNARWYTGGGIYRDVRLLVAPMHHITWQGVQVDTVSTDPAVVRVRTELTGPSVVGERVRVEILDKGEVVARGEDADATLTIPDARLWSAERPELYVCRVTLEDATSAVIDVAETTFGVRTLAWSAEKGFLVNGETVLLRGACVHHDNGMLGAASYDASEERKVRILKEQGFNALRSSHNPASPALLEACDRLGMYVIDETFDMWFQHKNPYDYASDFEACYLDDVRAMIERDRNHPSVVMYSIGNEVSEPVKPHGLEVAQNMIDLAHRLDPSRPVTAGINFMVLMMASSGKGLYDEGGLAKDYADGNRAEKDGGRRAERKSGSLLFNTMMSVLGKGINRMGNSKKADRATTPVLDLLDVCGYNYANGRYAKEGSVHPGRIIVGSETYPQDIADNWEKVERLSYVIGDFMWTGWDYLGEAAIGSWNYEGVSMVNVRYPWLLSGAGVVDICGRPDAQAAYAATVWGAREKPYLGVRPVNHPGVRVTKAAWRGTNAFDSWSWASCEGNKTTVEVYGRGETAELLVNGRSCGRRRLKKFRALFRVRYEPGTLTAVVYDRAGRELGRSELVSATGAVRLDVRPEVSCVRDGEIAYVAIELRGENDVLESNADRRVTLEVEGGELLGFGSAQPNPEESYLSSECQTWYGRAVAVVRASERGQVSITARDATGQVASAAIEVE